jgi:hypothetical protein
MLSVTIFDFLCLFAIIIIEKQMAADRRSAAKKFKSSKDNRHSFGWLVAVICFYAKNLSRGYNQWKR